ncbi:YpbF family protein [Lederbergia sp. NSJ-179]|uniref:DUF2663 family protein n=1 Tax=Lederbergia sp. NSJ-179 TaxID=2931402 RepID=UPI001FD6225E|nr:DUF2663 family protein [Lederbergia sp. NSJ-179]MCJ7839434.1 YpbF family protein [Lederbergia sp. NSJ-179]
MKSFLLDEIEKMDPITKRILQNLIDRKKKLNHYKQLHFFLLTGALLFSLVIFYFIFHTTVIPHQSSMLDLISIFLQQSKFIYFMLIAAALFGAVKITFEKMQKSEQEFHTLRCEVIDKSGDLWKGDRWGERHKVYEQMKNKYDINLYHQSK